MRRWHTTRFVLLGVGLAALWLWAGCNGGDGAPGPGPPGPPAAPAGPVTIVGRVVNATSLGTGIARAAVEAPGFGIADSTAFDGRFRLEGLPYGSVALRVEFPIDPTLRPQNVTVDLNQGLLDPANPVFSVTIAALPVNLGAPVQVQIIPNQRTVGLGAQTVFDAELAGAGGAIAAAPTWLVTGAIGSIDATGRFTAEKVGTGSVIAQSGTAAGFATVSVMPAGPPTIEGLVAAPASLPATGGDVLIAAYVGDADGLFIEDGTGTLNGEVVAVLSIAPGGAPTEMQLEFQGARPSAGTLVTAGTWSGTFTAPGNSNPIEPDGSQDPQVYETRVRARDLSGIPGGDEAISAPTTFEVRGADQPPPLP